MTGRTERGSEVLCAPCVEEAPAALHPPFRSQQLVLFQNYKKSRRPSVLQQWHGTISTNQNVVDAPGVVLLRARLSYPFSPPCPLTGLRGVCLRRVLPLHINMWSAFNRTWQRSQNN